MKHFQLVEAGISIQPFMRDLQAARRSRSGARRWPDEFRDATEGRVIMLQSAGVPLVAGEGPEGQGESRWTMTSGAFVRAKSFLEAACEVEIAELRRASIVQVSSSHRFPPHVAPGGSGGPYARYHLVLSSPAACRFHAGDEAVEMHEGQLWKFDHQIAYEARHRGVRDPLHLIFDLWPRCVDRARSAA